MTPLGATFVSLLILAGSWLAVRNPWRALVASVALLPWFGLDMDVGLRVTAFQLFVLPLVLVHPLRRGLTARSTGNCIWLLGLFMLYAVVVSAISLPLLPEADIVGGPLRSPTGRALTQIVMLGFTVAPLWVAADLCRSRDSFVQLTSTYIWSSLALALIGYLQVLVWHTAGENPIPFNSVNLLLTGTPGQYGSGAFALDNLTIIRMNSFGGEPKNLGQSLVVALLLLIWRYGAGIDATARRFVVKALLLLTAIFLTYSTSAFFFLVAGLLLLAGTGAFGGIRNAPRIASMLVLAIAASLTGAVILSEWFGLPIVQLVSARTVGRVAASQLGLLDDFDASIVDFLSDDWSALAFGVGLGNVHLFADPYLMPEVAAFAGNTSFVAKIGLLRVVSETGIVGASLLTLFAACVWLSARRYDGRVIRPALTIAVVAYFLVQHANLFYIIAGAVLGVTRAERRYAH